MDWETIYNLWKKQKLDNKLLANDKTINKFRLINEYNRTLYLDYHDDFLKQKGESSYRGYRSKITDFLVDDKINDKKLNDINESDLDDYFRRCKQKGESASNYASRVDFVKDFFDFHLSKLNVRFDFSRYRLSSKEIDEDKVNAPLPLNTKQLEGLRKLFQNNPLQLFFIEMVYRSGADFDVLRQCTYSNFDLDESRFQLKSDKVVEVPKEILHLVESLRDEWFFNANKDYHDLLDEMRGELRNTDFGRSIKHSDLKKTSERTFFNCPECGKQVEALVENWVSKQYYQNGNRWVVCNDCGEIE